MTARREIGEARSIYKGRRVYTVQEGWTSFEGWIQHTILIVVSRYYRLFVGNIYVTASPWSDVGRCVPRKSVQQTDKWVWMVLISHR